MTDQWVVSEAGVEVWIDRHCSEVDERHRVAVGRTPGASLGTDRTAGAGAVVDNDALAEKGRQAFGQPARPNVQHATRVAWSDDRDRP